MIAELNKIHGRYWPGNASAVEAAEALSFEWPLDEFAKNTFEGILKRQGVETRLRISSTTGRSTWNVRTH
ncbi:MAG: hypothetical protein JO317_03515 [Verrucomicrobiae bacterium]|nr:hypothetical protein [Verrucomicrobiae bacterium]